MEYEVTWINKKIAQIRMFVIDEMPTNCFVFLGSNNNYVIDTGFGSATSEIISTITDNSKLSIIINTHYHWDHIWGDGFFEGKPIIGHINLLKTINDKWDEMVIGNRKYARGEIKKILPNITFTDSLRFEEDGLELFYTPGHSDDSISCYFKKEKILVAGDNIGDNEKEYFPYLEDSLFALKRSLESYLKKAPEIIASGHHQITDLRTIEKIYTMCCSKMDENLEK